MNTLFHSLEIDSDALAHYCQSLRLAGPGLGLVALAQAIAASPGWAPGSEAMILVRPGPVPWLGVLGSLDPAREAWLRAQASTLNEACTHLRYLDWAMVQADCELLADRLVDSFGQKGIGSARFVAIPRGGFIVLGLLAPLLGLSREQMSDPGPMEEPLVVIDDCAVSGVRFARFLSQHREREVVFAHLYSHPELRKAVLAREPRVRACISAQDLQGRALASLPEACSWPSEGLSYWTGLPETLCFPWSEPDRSVWNPAAQRWELAWRVVPPGLCIKNRPANGSVPVSIQVQPEGAGPLRPADHVIFSNFLGRTMLGDLASGECFHLSGSAAEIWKALVLYGDLDQIVEHLAQEFDVLEGALREDVGRFVEKLLSRGLLSKAA